MILELSSLFFPLYFFGLEGKVSHPNTTISVAARCETSSMNEREKENQGIL